MYTACIVALMQGEAVNLFSITGPIQLNLRRRWGWTYMYSAVVP